MDLRAQIADLRNILQVQSLKIEKLEQTEINMKNIRNKTNELVESIIDIRHDIILQQDDIKRMLKVEITQDNDIKLLFKRYAELSNRQDSIEKSFSDLYDEWEEYER